MKKEKLIALLQALPDDAEVILFTEEGDLRNDFELELPNGFYFDVDVPIGECFILMYGYDSTAFEQTFKREE